jgi:hypothetical protein
VVAGAFDDEDDEDDEGDVESDVDLSLEELDFSEELEVSLELEPSELDDELPFDELLLGLLDASRLSLR